MDMAAIWKTARPGYWIGFTGSVGSIKQILLTNSVCRIAKYAQIAPPNDIPAI